MKNGLVIIKTHVLRRTSALTPMFRNVFINKIAPRTAHAAPILQVAHHSQLILDNVPWVSQC